MTRQADEARTPRPCLFLHCVLGGAQPRVGGKLEVMWQHIPLDVKRFPQASRPVRAGRAPTDVCARARSSPAVSRKHHAPPPAVRPRWLAEPALTLSGCFTRTRPKTDF